MKRTITNGAGLGRLRRVGALSRRSRILVEECDGGFEDRARVAEVVGVSRAIERDEARLFDPDCQFLAASDRKCRVVDAVQHERPALHVCKQGNCRKRRIENQLGRDGTARGAPIPLADSQGGVGPFLPACHVGEHLGRKFPVGTGKVSEPAERLRGSGGSCTAEVGIRAV